MFSTANVIRGALFLMFEDQRDRQAGGRHQNKAFIVEGKITHPYQSKALCIQNHHSEMIYLVSTRYVALEPFFLTCETRTHLL